MVVVGDNEAVCECVNECVSEWESASAVVKAPGAGTVTERTGWRGLARNCSGSLSLLPRPLLLRLIALLLLLL